MKFYVYVSDTKVDMLYGQIPPPIRAGIATELKLDLKLISVNLSKSTPETTRYSKLQLVSTFIENNEEIGTVDNPRTYFREVMSMRWGPLGEEDAMVYFGGVTDQTIVGLGGSLKHVIGAPGPTDIEHGTYGFPVSWPQPMLNALRNVTRTTKSISGVSDMEIIAYTTTRLEGPIQKFEFLATRLQEGAYHMFGNQSKVLLGSPIYVAIAE